MVDTSGVARQLALHPGPGFALTGDARLRTCTCRRRWVNFMAKTDTTDTNDLTSVLDEARKRGYIRRAELEAALRKAPVESGATQAPMGGDTIHDDNDDDDESPQITELHDLD